MPVPKTRREQVAKKPGPLWKGPAADGITFSMLSRFLCCRERFRVAYADGLKPAGDFNHRIEYGQMWHVCEEALAAGRGDWVFDLRVYADTLARRYPLRQEQVWHWYDVCRVQFPEYVGYWAKHPDVLARKPLLQEQVFDVPYVLPSGRTVRLRGKRDSVDLIGTGKAAGVYLQENKTKGDVDVEQVRRQLTFDLQTMMYLVALYALEGRKEPVGGVRYNVVRRPLSGGKGSIKQKQGETRADYYARLAGYISSEPETYFWRFKAEIGPHDVVRFRDECLDPILENVCDWYNGLYGGLAPKAGRYATPTHWRHPFGVYNVLDEGGHTELDAYLDTGSTVGLVRRDKLFEELE